MPTLENRSPLWVPIVAPDFINTIKKDFNHLKNDVLEHLSMLNCLLVEYACQTPVPVAPLVRKSPLWVPKVAPDFINNINNDLHH